MSFLFYEAFFHEGFEAELGGAALHAEEFFEFGTGDGGVGVEVVGEGCADGVEGGGVLVGGIG